MMRLDVRFSVVPGTIIVSAEPRVIAVAPSSAVKPYSFAPSATLNSPAPVPIGSTALSNGAQVPERILSGDAAGSPWPRFAASVPPSMRVSPPHVLLPVSVRVFGPVFVKVASAPSVMLASHVTSPSLVSMPKPAS